MRRPDALAHWRSSYNLAASAAARHRLMIDLGADVDLLRADDLEVTRAAAERDRLYSLLSPEDRAVADKIAKETP